MLELRESMHGTHSCYVVAFAALITGCHGLQTSYGNRPIPIPAGSAVEQCVHERAIFVGHGWARYSWVSNRTSSTETVSSMRREAPVFWMGGKRIAPGKIFEILGDPQADAAYHARLDERNERASGRRWRMRIGNYMMLGGLGTIAIGAVTQSVVPLLIGAGLFPVGSGLRFLGQSDDIHEAGAYSRLLIDQELARRAVAGAKNYNAQVQQRCAGGR